MVKLHGTLARAFLDARIAIDKGVKNYRRMLLSVGIDILFFIVYGFLTSPIRDSIVGHGILIGELLSQASKSFAQTREATPGIIELFFTLPEIRPWLFKLMLLFGLLLLTVFVIYVLFQGTAWKLARDIEMSEKTNYVKFITIFAVANIPWFLLFAFHNMISFVIEFRKTLLEKMGGSADVSMIIAQILFLAILALALWTAAFVSRAQHPARKAVRTILGQPLIYFSVIGIMMFIIDQLLMILGRINPALMMFTAVIVLFPMFFIVRIYLSEAACRLSIT